MGLSRAPALGAEPSAPRPLGTARPSRMAPVGFGTDGGFAAGRTRFSLAPQPDVGQGPRGRSTLSQPATATDSQQASGPGDPGFSSFHFLFRAFFLRASFFPASLFSGVFVPPRLCLRAYFPRISFRASFSAYFRCIYFSAYFNSNVGYCCEVIVSRKRNSFSESFVKIGNQANSAFPGQ